MKMVLQQLSGGWMQWREVVQDMKKQERLSNGAVTRMLQRQLSEEILEAGDKAMSALHDLQMLHS